MMPLCSAALALLLLLLFGAAAAVPTGLRCEYLVSPNGIATAAPRLSWINPLDTSRRGISQVAYQVIVSASPACAAGDMWDSGRVLFNTSIGVHYAGKPFAPNTAYTWRVKTWLSDGSETAFSDIATFRTTLDKWAAQWIGGLNMLRTEFDIPDGAAVKSAVAYVTGVGYYALWVNGQRVSPLLDPGWTTYAKRVLYSSIDIARALRPGRNAFGAMIGRGWYVRDKKGPVSFLLQAEITLQDGNTIRVTSNTAAWKASPKSPLLSDDIYDGSTYDARLEQAGWAMPHFDATGWVAAAAVQPPTGVLTPQMMEPIQKIGTVRAKHITQPQKGTYVVDFEQNFSGYVVLHVPRLSAGTQVVLRFAEILKKDGSGMIYTENLRGAKATDTFIARGGAEEDFEPLFTYHGFRYVELKCSDSSFVPDLTTLLGVHFASAMPQVGNISFSIPILNQIQHNIIWGQRSNLFSVPTDW